MSFSKAYQLAFGIKKNSNPISKQLIIEIFHIQTGSVLGPPVSFKNESDLILSSPEQERSIIKILFQQEMLFREKLSIQERQKPISAFTITPQVAFSLLQKLGSTGKLFFEKKKLICDFFNRLNLSITKETNPDDNIKVMASLTTSSYSCKLKECDLIGFGFPIFIISGNFLRFLDDDISWKELELLQKKEIFSSEEFNVIVKELPPSTIQDLHISHEIKPKIIVPTIFLRDPNGTTLELMFDYKGEYLPFFSEEVVAKKSSIQRDTKAETLFEQDLKEAGFERKKMHNSSHFCSLNSVQEALDLIIGCGWRVFDNTGRIIKRLTSLDYTFSYEDEIKIIGKARFEEVDEEIEPLISTIKKNKLFFPLKDGSCGLLSSSPKLSMLYELKDEIEIISNTPSIKRNRLGLISKNLDSELPSFNQTVDSANTISQQFNGTLRPYQEKGVQWLNYLYKNGFSGLLSDEMGLGKTVQALAFIGINSPQKCLIVAPSSLLFNWKREIETFLPNTSFYTYAGVDREKKEIYDPKNRIILTSYAILRGDIDIIEKEKFTFLFLDEAQAIKNMDTKTYSSVARVHTSFKLSITGTPIENSYKELYSQFQFLMKDLLPSTYSEQLSSYELKIIKKKVAPFILRRKKEDVAKDLPEKIEQTIFVEMHDEQRLLYSKFLSSFKAGLIKKTDEAGSISSFEVLEAILRLRQISCHPQLVPQLLEESISSGKFELVLTDLENLISEGKKVILFSQFTTMLTLFTKEAKERGFSYLRFDGETKNREQVVDAFQNDASISILFMSLKAGGVGLNLTKADAVLIYDPWWNLAQEEQAIARAHRIGKVGTLIVRRYVMKDTIEEKILKLQKEKKEISSSILDENEVIANIGFADLKELLS